jgi:pyruvate/oxaloacetate carboxyltransferase
MKKELTVGTIAELKAEMDKKICESIMPVISEFTEKTGIDVEDIVIDKERYAKSIRKKKSDYYTDVYTNIDDSAIICIIYGGQREL